MDGLRRLDRCRIPSLPNPFAKGPSRHGVVNDVSTGKHPAANVIESGVINIGESNWACHRTIARFAWLMSLDPLYQSQAPSPASAVLSRHLAHTYIKRAFDLYAVPGPQEMDSVISIS
jgi:hypothetical protein